MTFYNDDKNDGIDFDDETTMELDDDASFGVIKDGRGISGTQRSNH